MRRPRLHPPRGRTDAWYAPVVTDEGAPGVERLHEAARAAWPGVEVDRARFAAYLLERAPGSHDLGALHTDDLYLACACTAGDAAGLAAFEARYVAEVPAFLAGVERSAAAVDDVCQLVRERLFVPADDGRRPKIAEYSGRGSLGSWLRVVTLRIAANRRRGDRPHESLDEVGAFDLLPAVDPELAIIKSRYRPAFDEALRAAFAGLTPRERLLFRMHFLDGLNIDRIGVVFGVHRATVARWIAAARDRLLERLMRGLGERLRIAPAELESLLAVVRSGLDVSLRALLSPEAGGGAP
jgi:RNA polymerase sigma-70 factor (ECF subfamily)